MPKIEFNVKDENVNKVLSAFSDIVGKEIRIELNDVSKNFVLEERFEGENDIDFAKRISKDIIINFIKIQKFSDDNKRYIEEIKAVEIPKENISNTIIE